MPDRIRMLNTIVLTGAEALRINRLMRWMSRGRLLVLCYHSVVPDDTPDDPRTTIAVTKSQFELQLLELKRTANPVSESQVLAACENSSPLPPKSVLVTFDDGFRNNLLFAAPLLRKYEIPASIFLTSALIGGSELLWTQEIVERLVAWPDAIFPSPDRPTSSPLPSDTYERISIARRIVASCKALPDTARRDYLRRLRLHPLRLDSIWKNTLYEFMTWQEVCQLRGMGFSFGAHTVDHPILTSLSISELSRQLCESKRMIEEALKQSCVSIAYPNGSESDYSPEVIQAAEHAGFRLGFTLKGRRNPAALLPMVIDRVCVTRSVTIALFRAKTAGWA